MRLAPKLTESISIHPPRAGRDSPQRPSNRGHKISIHPPRAGRDYNAAHAMTIFAISIHPPRAGRDFLSLICMVSALLFQSTRPVRGGTKRPSINDHKIPFQSTRPMRGGTIYPTLIMSLVTISIHPPHAGRDLLLTMGILLIGISIHPPHAGRDCNLSDCRPHQTYFNPPAPCGAGLSLVSEQSGSLCISIHPPHAGRDLITGGINKAIPRFQSTRPMRGGTICYLILEVF